MLTLEQRMISFLGSLPGAECIDELLGSDTQDGKKRADFLVEDRRIIVELKTLKVDPSHKVEEELGKHRERPEFPRFYGSADLSKVLSHLPDGQQIQRRILNSVTRTVEAAVRSAEEQIRDTRGIFNLEHSAGLLVLLNESIEILSPKVLVKKVSALMYRTRSGKSDAQVVDFAWLLSEGHLTPLVPGLDAFPSVLIEGSSDGFPWFRAAFQRLEEGWAKRNYGAYATSSAESLDGMTFESSERVKSPPPKSIRRYEVWEREYDANPFLRSLSDEQVLEYGADVFRRTAPFLLTGGPRAPREEMDQLRRAATCFFRESSYRALDLRRMPRP